MSDERLVVYGDFNCPYSALASARAARLEESGIEVDWRAVEHDAAMPPEGVEVAGEVRHGLERELDEIRGLLTDDEEDHLRLPDHRPNTARATAGYAEASPADRPDLRRALFAAVWQQGDPDRVAQIGSGDSESVTAAGWRREWQALPQQVVPTLVEADGRISAGVDGLRRLALLQSESSEHEVG